MATTRKFGIEIEAYGVAMNVVAAEIRAAGIECHQEGYNHIARPHWKVVTDASLHAPQSFELVSPVLEGAEGLRQITVVCGVLNALGAKVNKTCGLHVHVDARDLGTAALKSVVKQFMKYESCFDRLVPTSRRANIYCKSNRDLFSSLSAAFARVDACQTTEALRGVMRCDRYFKLNLESLVRHGTVEFRQHSGTVDAAKIIAWVGLVTGLVQRCAKAPEVKEHGAGVFRDLLKAAPAAQREFLAKRAAELAATAE